MAKIYRGRWSYFFVVPLLFALMLVAGPAHADYWEPVGTPGFSDSYAWYTSLALDSSDMPYVAYADWANDGRATVMRFTGAGATGWEPVGTPGFSADRAEYISLALDSNGTPSVAIWIGPMACGPR